MYDGSRRSDLDHVAGVLDSLDKALALLHYSADSLTDGFLEEDQDLGQRVYDWLHPDDGWCCGLEKLIADIRQRRDEASREESEESEEALASA